MTGDDLTMEEIGEERYEMDDGADVCDEPDPPATTGSSISVSSSGTTGSFTFQGASGTISVPTYATGTSYTSVQGSPPKTTAIFDLKELGVIQEGTFDQNGNPTGWSVSPTNLPIYYPTFMNSEPVLYLGWAPDYIVNVRGIFSRHYTNERRAAMGLGPL